ncbi:MAG: hypothetical protein CBE07_003105 [Pelagibacteraceae bacterium TMED247]|nr:MAG: hypothetical protein CBE07_003105 [Pelagibacteraceae bacterium TMED247]|tara:strand:- start:3324 stop:5249 length:1926 start_codon:yes stop_codon:yes gene_type:complete
MAILKYTASADNTITNAFDDSLVSTNRATGSNSGKADVMEIFGIYGQASSSSGLSSEISRALVKFDVTQINTDRTAGTLPAQGSVNFFLKLYNTPHASTTPEDYKLTIARVTNDWEEGYGLDLDNYTDKTYDGVGSNWVNGNGTFVSASATITALSKTAGQANTRVLTIADSSGNSVGFQIDNSLSTSTATKIAFANANSNPTQFATNIITAVNLAEAASTLSVTGSASGATVTLEQTAKGYAGNSAADISGTAVSDSVVTIVSQFSSGSGEWATAGGDFSTATNNFVDASFPKGTENLEIDVTTIVENWLGDTPTNENYGFMVKLSSSLEPYYSPTTSATGSQNTSGAKRSFFTKKFFSRGTEYFFKRPCLEARWDDSVKDDRGNIYLSSSLAPASDNLNTIFLYNYIRGELADIAGDNSIVPNVKFYYASGSVPEGTPRTFIHSNTAKTAATATRVSTGLYSISFAINKDQFPEGYSNLVDVWNYSNAEVHTGSAMTPKSFSFSNTNPNVQYVLSLSNLREYYNNVETARFRVFIREKGWSPTIYTRVSNKLETLTVPSASYEIYRVIDDAIVIPYGTGSSPSHTMLSHDVSGNYFDLDMSMLEGGYSYGIRISIYESSIGSYREQPYTFKFKVNKYEY